MRLLGGTLGTTDNFASRTVAKDVLVVFLGVVERGVLVLPLFPTPMAVGRSWEDMDAEPVVLPDLVREPGHTKPVSCDGEKVTITLRNCGPGVSGGEESLDAVAQAEEGSILDGSAFLRHRDAWEWVDLRVPWTGTAGCKPRAK
jgi:hypothetical protein